MNLVELIAKDGTTGYGECTVAPDQAAVVAVMESVKSGFEGESVYDIAPLRDRLFERNNSAFGANLMRAANQIFSGFDIAALELRGKLAFVPVWDLFGGSYRDRVWILLFLQGDSPKALARHAAEGASQGKRVFYLEVGRDEASGLEICVRRAI